MSLLVNVIANATVLAFSQRLQRLLNMRNHTDFAVNDFPDNALFINHKGRAPDSQTAAQTRDPVKLAQFIFRIADERKVQFVAVRKFAVRLLAVAADANDLGVQLIELSFKISKMAGFFSATGRKIFRIN